MNKTIGVLAGWPLYNALSTHNFLDSVLRGIRVAARELDCNLLIACGLGSARDDDLVRPAWPVPAEDTTFVPVGPWNTDGLIVINPLLSPARSAYIQELRRQGHPIVFLGTAENGSAVALDNEGGIRQALVHLVTHGHRDIAFIEGNPADETGDSGERLQAYQTFVQEFGLTNDRRLIACGQHTVPGGERAMRAILSSGVACTAVLASNDESAIGAMNVLHEQGYQIPQDMAVIGFDDRPTALVQTPPLTTIHNSTFERGYRALGLLMGMLQEPTADHNQIIVHSSSHLVIRQSCGCDPDLLFESNLQSVSHIPQNEEAIELLNRMTQLLLAESRRLGSAILFSICRRLYKAFALSVEKGEAVIFRCELHSVLDEIEQAGEEAHVWQMPIAILAEYFAAQSATDVSRKQLNADLLRWAQVTISRHVQRQYRTYLIEQDWVASRSGILNAYLVETTSLAEIYDVLAQYLPDVGIKHAALVYFDAEGETAVSQRELTIHSILNPALSERKIPVHAYSPLAILPEETAHHLALFPLTVEQQQIGFIVFQPEKFAICEIVIRQIAAAMRSARLYQAAEEGRRLAEEANQTQTRFLSMVSHELRTPLSLVVGLSEMLIQDSRQGNILLDSSRTEQIERIHTSAQHLDGLIQDVLDLTRGDMSQIAFDPEPLLLQEVLAATLSIGEQLAVDKGLKWIEDVPKRPFPIYGDRGRLRQVLLNLINNAVKFTAEGEICFIVTTDHDETMVEMVVQDSGVGVPDAEREMIFEPFHQSKRTADRGYGGLGLGLAISKHFVALHQGEFGVKETDRRQGGAAFYVRLPVLPLDLPTTTSSTYSKKADPYVLIVEPSKVPIQRLIDLLKEDGFNARVISDGADENVMATILENPPHAIVLDARVPVQQGWHLFHQLKNNRDTQDIPILFYELEQSEDSGAMITFDYLRKPIDSSDLSRVLQQYNPAQLADEATYTVLIVDDDPGILDMHAKMIQRQWPTYHIVQAKNGREALEVMRDIPPNLVLLDLMMPEVDGFAVIATMRQEEALRHIPVIVLTANVLTEVEMARLHQGVTTVLKKGVFSVDETLCHIREALECVHKMGDEKRRLVRRAMAFIHEQFTEQITREDITDYVGVSKGYLSRSFRDELGLAPISYLNRYRVSQAKRLLIESQHSITEIAFMVGFSDGNYFSRVFRREVGESPKAYREKYNV